MRRQGSESSGAETRIVRENTAREGELPVRARPRESTRSRSVASSDRDEPGGHRYETLAESQTEIPLEFGGKELRERDDVPSRPWRASDESNKDSDEGQHG